MLWKIVFVATFASILASCVSAAEQARQAAQIAADSEIARQHFRADVEGADCIRNFKARMNDPSSFELGRQLTFDVVRTNAWHQMGLSLGGYSRMAVFSAPVRGKNGFGGLVLQTLTCTFGIRENGELDLIQATSS